jgi:HK97 gp10 family phage protein
MYEPHTLSGGDALAALLIKLPAEVEGHILLDAGKTAMQPMLEAAIAHCPVYDGPPRADIVPGLLKASLKLRVKRASDYVRVAVVSGEGDFVGHTFYALMVEFGHGIGNRPTKGQKDTRGRTPMHPFIRPAFDETKDQSLEIFGRETASGIENAAK